MGRVERDIVPALAGLSLFLAACSGSSSGGGGGASTVAPSTSGTTAAPTTSGTTPATPSGPRDFTGIWEISGTDPGYGDYHGTAAIVASGSTYNIQRLVTYQTKLASGHQIISAWNATGTPDPAGLRVRATLRRAHVALRVGTLTRTAADRAPLVVDGLLAAPGGTLGPIKNGTTIQGTLPSSTVGAGVTEKWVRASTGPAPDFPVAEVKEVPLHGPPASWLRSLMWATFGPYHKLPAIAPYVARPEFQAAIHTVPVDHTARDFLRKQGPGFIVILDTVTDDVSIFEERCRADALSRLLHDKAAGFDADMEARHVDANGMIGDYVFSTGTIRPSGDGALHVGCWVASQCYRFQATGDKQAFANVERGVNALCLLVEITPTKSEFARAIAPSATAPSSYTAGAGAYAGISWLPGGNNDMLHGIDYGFLCAEQVLPAGHPLRARMGAAAKSLLDNVKIAQSGTHQIFLSSVAWRTTQDPAEQTRYKGALNGNLKDRLWLTAGNGLINEQGISDWSGHHLGQVTFCGLRILGGANPGADEQGWRQVGASGSRAAFGDMRPAREGLLGVIAAANGATGAADDGKDILAEIPYPKPRADAIFQRDVSDDFCLSPYPSLPWKNDWMSNPGRVQALTGLPLFYRGGDENYWARSPLSTGSGVDQNEKTSQDFLHAYWLGRATGVIQPGD